MKITEAPRIYIRGIYSLQALERLSPERGIRYSSTAAGAKAICFRRTRPWLHATGEWRAEGSSLDGLTSVESREGD